MTVHLAKRHTVSTLQSKQSSWRVTAGQATRNKIIDEFWKYIYTICLNEYAENSNKKADVLLDIITSAFIDILLSLVCNANASLDDINILINSIFFKGYYATLTEGIGISGLKKPNENLLL